MNANQEINTSGRICLPMCQRVISTDISEDFTLPDYNPEIRRVLYVRENLLPPSKFISGNKLDVNGVADYTLVYISNEGRLCSAPLTAEYGFSLGLEGVGDFELSEGVSIMVHSVAETSSVRVSSPRRLQIRTHIRSVVNAWGKKSTAESVESMENPESLQYRHEETVCADIVCESSDIVPLTDEYTLSAADCRVALADSAVQIQSCSIDGEIVRVKGVVLLRMLLMYDGEGRCERVTRRLEFDAESDLDGVDMVENCFCRASGSVTDIALNVEEGKVNTEANLVLEICVGQNRPVSYIRDMYSTEQAGEIRYREENLPIVLENKNFNFTQNERIPLSELNIPDSAQITDVSACAVADSMIEEDGRYVLRGSCKYNVICQSEGEYTSSEMLVPFRYEIEFDRPVDSFDALVDVLGCKARNDGEAINVDAELAVAATVLGSQRVTMVDRAVFDSPRETEKGQWTVSYVRDSDGLWDIAKRYGVAAEDIKGNPETDRFVIIER